MRISIVAYGTWGDVRPGIALGQALKQAGFDVQIIVTEDFVEWVKDTGLDFHLLPINAHDVLKQVSVDAGLLPGIFGNQPIAAALLKAGQDLIAVARSKTDVLIVNEWLIGIASGIAETYHLKLINMAMQPRIKTREHPISSMPVLPVWMPFRGIYNSLTYDAVYFAQWRNYVRIGNSLRQTPLNLPPLSPSGNLDLLANTPSITLISPQIVPHPSDWDHHHYLTGFLFYDDEGWKPPAELMDFLDSGPAPIYVGFGSLHDPHPTVTTRLILRALELSNQRAVLHSGWAELGQVDLPENIYRLDYAPHSWLFPRMAAVVHHAGAGTSAAALRAGVPSVPVPHSGDQPFWARTLYQIGAGTRSLAWRRLNADDLAQRITVAVTDTCLRKQTAELGRRIVAEDGAGATVSAIERILARDTKR